MKISCDNKDVVSTLIASDSCDESSVSSHEVASSCESSCRKRHSEGTNTACDNGTYDEEHPQKKSKCNENTTTCDVLEIRFTSVESCYQDDDKNGISTEDDLTSADDDDDEEDEISCASFDSDDEDSDDEDNEEDCEYDCEEILKGICVLQDCIKSYQHERELVEMEQQNRLHRQRLLITTTTSIVRSPIQHSHYHCLPNARPVSPICVDSSEAVTKITPNNSSDDLISYLVTHLQAIEKQSMQHLLFTSGL